MVQAPRPRVARLPALLGVALAWGGCPLTQPVDVVAAQEQPVSGVLALDEAQLSARLEEDGLHVVVPPLAAVAWPVDAQASVRGLDGNLLGGGRARGLANAPLELVLGAGGEMDRVAQQASRVLHLRVSGGLWEVRARRSLRALLRAPVTTLEVPAWVPQGSIARWLVSSQEPDVDLTATTSTNVQTTPLLPLSGGFEAQLSAVDLGPASLTVRATRNGAPRRTDVDLAVVPRPTLTVVTHAPQVRGGQPLHVVVVGTGAPTAAVLESADGTRLAMAALGLTAPGVWYAPLVAPWDTPAGPARVVVLGGDTWLADAPVQLAGQVPGPQAVTVDAVETGPQVTLRLRAQDVAGKPQHGQGRLVVLHQGTTVVDAHGALEQGGLDVTVRSAALLHGRSGGALEVVGSVTGSDGRAASSVTRVLLGGERLAVRAWAAPCAQSTPCRVDVAVVDGDGLPAQASVDLVLMDATATVATQADGTAWSALQAGSLGPAVLSVTACGAPGCGSTELPVVVRPKAEVGPMMAGPLAWEAGSGWPGSLLGQALAGTVGVRAPTQRGGRDPYVVLAQAALPTGGAGPGVVLDGLGLGQRQVQTVAVGEGGTLLAAARPLVVHPRQGTGPVVLPQDGRVVARSSGALVLGQWTCGASTVGPEWRQGLWGLDVTQAASLGGRAQNHGPATAALWTQQAGGTSALQDPGERQAQQVMEAYVRADLARITAEARALAREGSLTGTGVGAWVRRREHAYVDPFGRPYLLQAVEGRLVLRGDGPDETPDTADDAQAETPLEALLQDVRPGGGVTTPTTPEDLPLELPAASGRLAMGMDQVTLADPPNCAHALTLGLVALYPDGRVGARRLVPGMSLPVGLLWAAPRWTVGDQAPVATYVAGAAGGTSQLVVDAPWGVDRLARQEGTAQTALTAQRVGVATAFVDGLGMVGNQVELLVQPDGARAVETVVQLCDGTCTLALSAGERVTAWTGAQACEAALARMHARVLVEAAGTALVAAVAGDQARFQDAFAVALAESAEYADQRLATAEAAAVATQRWGLLPAHWPAPFMEAGPQAQDALWPSGVTAAVEARVLEQPAASVLAQLDNALARGDADAALEAGLLAQQLAALPDGTLATLEGLGGATVYGTAALARTLAARGRPLDAALRLTSLGEFLGHPAPLQAQARVAAAWCALSDALPSGAAGLAVSGPGGTAVPVNAGAFRAGTAGDHVVTPAAGPVLLARTTFTDRAVTLGPLPVVYASTHVAVGDTVAATALRPTGAGRGAFLLSAAPGTSLALPPNGVARVEDHTAWLQGDAVSFQLRALGPLDVRLAPLAYWPAHTAAAPYQDAPPRLSAQ